MIIPIATEQEWSSALQDVPGWQPPLIPTVVVAPHPDDETLAAGGLIATLRAQQVPVDVIAVTDGENAYAVDCGLGPIREIEQTRALQRLGMAPNRIHRLRFPDSGMSGMEADLAAALQPLLQRAGHIVAPWPHDFHPDHEITGRAAAAIARQHGIPLTFYFFWTWHRGTPQMLQNVPLRRLPLNASEQHAKQEALAFHVSQLQHPSGEPILPANLLEPAWRPCEIFLPA